jgi:hypothetical protein
MRAVMEAAAPPPPPPPAQAPPPASKGVEVGRVLSETFRIYGDQAGVLLGTAAVIFVVVGLVQGALISGGDTFLFFLASVLGYIAATLYTGFVSKLVEDVRDGRRDFSVGELLGAAASVLGVLIVNSILFGIAVGIGFILLIVPGLILLTIWAVTAPAIVIERRGPIEAFGRSWELVKGDGWSVFGVIVVVFLIGLAIALVTALLGSALGDAGYFIFRTIGSVIAAPIGALAAAVMFFDLGGGAGAADPAVAAPAGEAPPAPPPPPS